MKARRSTKLLVEPPAAAIGDIVFNLIVFFLVTASVQPDSGRHQEIPRGEEKEEKQTEQMEVLITRSAAMIQGAPVAMRELPARLKELLKNKPRPEDRVVVVQSKPDVPYRHWIAVTAAIEQAGGVITIQREEERQVVLPD